MTKLGDVVFCVDCDEARLKSLPPANAARNGALGADADSDLDVSTLAALNGERGEDAETDSSETASSENGLSQDGADAGALPRRMATKKDANGDPLCSACLDERQSRRRAEFMLADERRTVVHWPRGGRRRIVLGQAAAQLPLDPAMLPNLTTLPPDDEPEPEAPEAEAAETEAAGAEQAQPGTLSKAAFVRGLPASMPAKEVIARARKLGFKLTPAYVYVIRSNAVRADIRAASNGHNGAAGRAETSSGRAAKGRTSQARGAQTRHAQNGQNGQSRASRANGSRTTALPGLQNGLQNGRNGQALNGSPARTRANGAADRDKRRGRGQLTLDRVPERVLSQAELEVRQEATSGQTAARNGRTPKLERGVEQRFMWLAIELGFFRTQQLIDQLRTRLRAALAKDRRSAPRRERRAAAAAPL